MSIHSSFPIHYEESTAKWDKETGVSHTHGSLEAIMHKLPKMTFSEVIRLKSQLEADLKVYKCTKKDCHNTESLTRAESEDESVLQIVDLYFKRCLQVVLEEKPLLDTSSEEDTENTEDSPLYERDKITFLTEGIGHSHPSPEKIIQYISRMEITEIILLKARLESDMTALMHQANQVTYHVAQAIAEDRAILQIINAVYKQFLDVLSKKI